MAGLQYASSVPLRQSLIYDKHDLQPPLEVVLKMFYQEENEVFRNLERETTFDPLLILDSEKDHKVRPIEKEDGIFYHLCNRPSLDGNNLQRPTTLRLLICMTMYNEDRDQFEQSLSGIHANLKNFRKKYDISNEDIAVCVLMDGIEKVNPTIWEYFDELDKAKGIPKKKTMAYRKKIFKNEKRKPKWAKFPRNTVYMYQTNIVPEKEEDQHNYLNVFLCCKLENGGKLSSHLWFFMGFCDMFNPKYCALLDCGTIPSPEAYVHFFTSLECDPLIGGVCGYMGLFPEPVMDEFGKRTDKSLYDKIDDLSKLCMIFFDIQKAQVFEYAFSHILDKSFESFFGFIHVLPGAFSAYRWDVLRIDKTKPNDVKILHEYLKTVWPTRDIREEYSIAEKNMYLAEDRILCLEIFAKRNFYLKYIPDAICHTDPIKNLADLMNQRRRWINGSLYALLYVLKKSSGRIFRSKHSPISKFMFLFSMFFAFINVILSYFTVGLYFVFITIMAIEVFDKYNFYDDPKNTISTAGGIMIFVYIMLVLSLFFYSLLLKSRDAIRRFQFISTLLGLFTLVSFGSTVYVTIKILAMEEDNTNLGSEAKTDAIMTFRRVDLQILAILTIVCYGVPVILNPTKSLIDILFSTIDYLFYMPTYIHTLLIYAFCNIDDLSWGTKGLESRTLEADKYKKYKAKMVGFWLFANMTLGYIIYVLNYDGVFKNYFILVMGYFFTILLVTKFVFAVIYHFKFYIFERFFNYFKMKNFKGDYKNDTKNLENYIQQIIRPPLPNPPLPRPIHANGKNDIFQSIYKGNTLFE